MSSKPSVDGVRNLRELIRESRAIETEIREITPLVKKLPALEERFHQLSGKIIKAMEEMDVASSGNFGWEGRMRWFLAELERQASSNTERGESDDEEHRGTS